MAVSPCSFSDLGVPAPLAARLAARGITSPFPIQRATVPDAIAGRDVCGRAPTGSGKTLAFGLALATRVDRAAPRRPRGLVLVPTRELAAQVREELAQLTGDRGRRVLAVYGGTGYGPSRRALDAGVDIVVACPGRLEDLVAQGALDLGDVHAVVLDEADRMADMGFLPAVRRLMDQTAPNRQVLLFSATIGAEVEAIVERYQHDPARHSVVADEASVGQVSHAFWAVPRTDRVRTAADLVATHGQAIVFCRTKRGADRVARQLTAAGVPAVAIHGDRTQSQRERALASFVGGGARALVATDVAARGIHVDDLPCVVHYDLPAEATDYVHRSGRTGRAGNHGMVVSLVTEEHHGAARTLQRALGLPQQLDRPGPGHPPAAGHGPRGQRPGDRARQSGDRARQPGERARQPGERARQPGERAPRPSGARGRRGRGSRRAGAA